MAAAELMAAAVKAVNIVWVVNISWLRLAGQYGAFHLFFFFFAVFLPRYLGHLNPLILPRRFLDFARHLIHVVHVLFVEHKRVLKFFHILLGRTEKSSSANMLSGESISFFVNSKKV